MENFLAIVSEDFFDNLLFFYAVFLASITDETLLNLCSWEMREIIAFNW